LDEAKRLKLADQWAAEAAVAAGNGDFTGAATLGTIATINRTRIGGARAYYTTIGQQIQSFLLHVTYADLKKPRAPPASGDQRSVALGLNYDINVDSVIKLEAKQIMLPDDNSQGLFLVKPDNKTAMVYRLGYSMIF
jgi:hypothetical protein